MGNTRTDIMPIKQLLDDLKDLRPYNPKRPENDTIKLPMLFSSPEVSVNGFEYLTARIATELRSKGYYKIALIDWHFVKIQYLTEHCFSGLFRLCELAELEDVTFNLRAVSPENIREIYFTFKAAVEKYSGSVPNFYCCTGAQRLRRWEEMFAKLGRHESIYGNAASPALFAPPPAPIKRNDPPADIMIEKLPEPEKPSYVLDPDIKLICWR